MKVINALIESCLGILIYVILTSVFYYLKLNLFSLEINLNQFIFYNIISSIYLRLFYILFNFKLLLLFLSFYVLQNIALQNIKYNLLIKIVLFLVVFYALTLAFDSNFNANSKSLNQFLFDCISIIITLILVSKILIYLQSKYRDWNL